MKKFAFVLLISFILALVGSSCNKASCPAYSKGDLKHAKRIV